MASSENVKIVVEDLTGNCPPSTDRVPKGNDGPCRETAVRLLQRKIDGMERDLAGHRQLLKVAEKAEPGSPLEETIWGMLMNSRRGW